MRIAMMAITTSSSVSVKAPRRGLLGRFMKALLFVNVDGCRFHSCRAGLEDPARPTRQGVDLIPAHLQRLQFGRSLADRHAQGRLLRVGEAWGQGVGADL